MIIIITLFLSRGGDGPKVGPIRRHIIRQPSLSRTMFIRGNMYKMQQFSEAPMQFTSCTVVLFEHMHFCHTLVARPLSRPWHQGCAQESASLWRKQENSQTKAAGNLVPSHRATQTCSRIHTLQRSLSVVPMLRICSRTHTL